MKAYLVMKLVGAVETETGLRIDLQKDYQLGMMPVYKHKKGAREEFGKDVELMEININFKEKTKCATK